MQSRDVRRKEWVGRGRGNEAVVNDVVRELTWAVAVFSVSSTFS